MTEHAPAKILSGIDIPKTIAGTLAAVSAAVVGSFLGVAGTLIGAAVASLIGSVGTELYHRFINRGSEKIKTFVTAPAAVGTPPVAAAEDEVPSDEPVVDRRPVKMRWGRITAAAGLLFVLAMGGITVFELIAQRSIADAVGHKTSSSTTLGNAFKGDNGSDEKPATTPSTQPSADPTGEPTADPAETAAPTGTAAPTDTSAPAESPEPQQTDGTQTGTAPTEAPADGQTEPDGTTQDSTTQNGDVQNQQVQPNGTE
ncbi:hypothetical protein Aab01nite_32960 [Paractinoplanes abujensis]|uniref:Uncharacterized protein n=1 Tax=Paractinoplanes abujensis TaxID=882441 RepID=A0A7W7G4W7_9ACTN|nr:hypothetical protein [Actinoplanes abujensis]MBB4697808.1 hypothetical protein [Actinoplanes abujensis]GID19706.1 hypothetical protein Aab01nite_32960 [Actinoplanes abujensis]